MSIVDCAHHAEVRTHAKRKLQLHCQLQAAHILAASAASLLISFVIHRSLCHISTCVFIVDVHKYYIDWFRSMIYLIYRYTRVHLFPKTRHHMSQVHGHRQEPDTKASMGMVGMVITQNFWEHEVQHKVIRRFRWVWGEFLYVWMAGKYSKKPNESRFSLCYYIILICILLKFGRKTSTTIFTTFKLGTFPWTCRVHFKNMSHIDLVRLETNVPWWLFCILWLFYRIAILPCAGGALLLQIHPQCCSECCELLQSKVLHTHLKGVQASPAMSEVDCVQGFLATPISLLTSSLGILHRRLE